MSRALLTAVGSMAAPPVMQRLREIGFEVIGCDIYDRSWNASSMEADDFFQALPAGEGQACLEQMRWAVGEYGLEALIPLTDLEVDLLCPHKEEFAKMGCVLCVPEERVTRLVRRKDEMNRFLDSRGLCHTIPTFVPYGVTPSPDAFPLMLKPRSGRSSQGQVIAGELSAYQAALTARKDYIAQPYLEGPVWTVDVARDRFGDAAAAARRELLRNPSGLGMTVEVVPGHPLEGIAMAIAQAAGMVGVVNMEFIQRGEDYYFLEVNPRFSGGVGFSMAAGADMAGWMLRCHRGEPLGPRPALQAMTLARENRIVRTR